MRHWISTKTTVKGLSITIDTDLGRVTLGAELTCSSDGNYAVILKDENGDYLETMKPSEKSMSDMSIYETSLEHAYGVLEVSAIVVADGTFVFEVDT